MITTQRELPILFNDEMVRAILEGRKTQTRRPVKPQPEEGTDCPYHIGVGESRKARKSPFGSPGDLLWVRECWAQTDGRYERHRPIAYRASDDGAALLDDRWRPSIHMPRWASRLQLRVKRTWIESLQSLTESGARAEGVPRNYIGDLKGWSPDEHGFLDFEGSKATAEGREILEYGHFTALEAFPSRWDAIYASRGLGWASNPCVWACEFEVVR